MSLHTISSISHTDRPLSARETYILRQAIMQLRRLAEVHASAETARALAESELHFLIASRAIAGALERLLSEPDGERLREIAMDLYDLADMARFFAHEAFEIGSRIP